MMMNSQKADNKEDAARLELHRLIGEGYLAMKEGRVSTFEEVKKNLEKRREMFG